MLRQTQMQQCCKILISLRDLICQNSIMKYLPYFFICLFFFACNADDEVEIENEEEVITTLQYVLTPTAGGNAVTLQFEDADGDGPGAPVLTVDALAANTTYNGAITLSNVTETPAEDVTEEIEEEDDEHQFFFSSTVSGLTVAYADEDGDGNPVGLATTLTTGAAGSGTLTVTLRHEPSKDASGVSAGDITNAGGETDIEVTFNIDVQ